MMKIQEQSVVKYCVCMRGGGGGGGGGGGWREGAEWRRGLNSTLQAHNPRPGFCTYCVF